jgi:pilus assembly protein CpaB
VAASRSLASGESLTLAMMAPVDWNSPVAVDGAITNPEKALGRIVAYPIAGGMILTEKSLAAPGSSFGLPEKIPVGMRAIAVKTDEVADLGGFLFPGTHVDVLLTIGGGGSVGAQGGSGSVRTIVVLEDVDVLAVGKQMIADPSDKPTPVSVVNLLVNADDARKIALAEQQGSLHLTLRNSGDRGSAEHKVTYLTDITGSPASAVRVRTKEGPAPQRLEMTLGSKGSVQTYRDNIPVSESSSALNGGGNSK